MERQLEQLVHGDLSTRTKILQEADDVLLAEIIRKIGGLTEDMFNIEERQELNALNYAYNSVIKNLKNDKTPLTVKIKILKFKILKIEEWKHLKRFIYCSKKPQSDW